MPTLSIDVTDPNQGKRVYIGTAKGETPRKEVLFSRMDAPNTVPSATPLRQNSLGLPLRSSLSTKSCENRTTETQSHNTTTDSTPDKNYMPLKLPERPSTSRGKAHPSPDEFTTYIKPSPQSKLDAEMDVRILSFGKNSTDPWSNTFQSLSSSNAKSEVSQDALRALVRELLFLYVNVKKKTG